MPEHWIAAREALEIVGDKYALCARLREGLVQARAKLFVAGDRREEGAPIPKEFWWAGGHEALEQDWATGDFSTWIKEKHHFQAFGVSIGLTGLLEMVAFEKRAAIALSLSVAGNPDWIAAKQARSYAYDTLGHNPMQAGSAIVSQAQLGFVTARAVLAQGATGNSSEDDWLWEAREWGIPVWFWNDFTDPNQSNQDWTLGKFSGRGPGPNKVHWITLNGVHFLRESIVALGQPKADSIASANTKSGRPTEYGWLEATNAIWAKLYGNELKPMRQADIERALIQHLRKGDNEPSQSTVRPFAKAIWEKFQEL